MFCLHVVPFHYSSHLSLSASKLFCFFKHSYCLAVESHIEENTAEHMGTKKCDLVCTGKFLCARALWLPTYCSVTPTNKHPVPLWRKIAVRLLQGLQLTWCFPSFFYCWNADLCLVVGKLARKYLNRTCRTLWHLTGCTVEHWERRLTPLRSHSQLSLEGHSDRRNFLKNGRKQIFLFSSRGARKRIYRPVSLTLNPGKEQAQGRARKMNKGLEHLSCDENLRWDCSSWRRLRGILSMCINTWWNSINKMSLMLVSGAQWKDKKKWTQSEYGKFH